MILFEKAFEIVMNSAPGTGTEIISFNRSLNRILACDVVSDMDMPPFNKSAVDGFACKRENLNHELKIIETIPAGKIPERKIGKWQCSRIMTGAPVPLGADCVIMVEDTKILPSGNVKFTGVYIKENFALRGEDVKRGDIVLRKGKMIRPQDIAVMAAVGCTTVKVSVLPVIAIISSGSELVEPSEVPATSQIRNSNSYQLVAQASRIGINAKYYGIAKDDEDETFEIISRAISESAVVIVTGGVSMGDFDFIPSVLMRAGVDIKFSRVAVQPGKPTTFGVHPKALVFGLPGNPVSSFIQFEMLVRPLIYKMMGYEWHPAERRLPMKRGFSRKFADRMALVPVFIDNEDLVSPVEFHGSAHISALHDADGIISVPPGITKIDKGEIVSVREI
jgi:molybdopterin molybdotransferase